MISIGTKFEYFDAVWVKNEWGRYLSMMEKDSSKHLIPCYKDIDAYDMPKEFKNLQALNISEMTFLTSLKNNVYRFIPKSKNLDTVSADSASNSVAIDTFLKRVEIFLADGEWEKADQYCEKVLDLALECGRAYLGKLLAEIKIKRLSELAYSTTQPYEFRNNYIKAKRFADKELLGQLEIYSEQRKQAIDRIKKEEEKRRQAEQLRNEEDLRLKKERLIFLQKKKYCCSQIV